MLSYVYKTRLNTKSSFVFFFLLLMFSGIQKMKLLDFCKIEFLNY